MTNSTARIAVLLLLTCSVTAMAAEDGPDFSQEFLATQYDAITPAVCLLTFSAETTNQGSGEISKRDTRSLGVIVSPDGLVMAYGHMQVENTEPFNIRAKVGVGENEEEYDVVLLKKPDNINVCFLRITPDKPVTFPYVTFARGEDFSIGEPLVVFGLMAETLDFSRGLLERRIAAVLDKPRTTYCMDRAMPFGYVGGPVVDRLGRVIGVVGYDLSPAEGGELYVRSGHPLLYNADLFIKYIDNPPSESEADSGGKDAWLGVFSQPLSDELAEYWGLEQDGGIVISTIVAGSPAEANGLMRGDILLDFNGTPLNAKKNREIVGFTKLVRDAGAGSEAAIKFLRDGKPREMTLQLTERPKSSKDAGEFEDTVFGLTVREITQDVRIMLNLEEGVQGVIVRNVKSGGWANLARMIPGAIILRFGEYPVTNLDDFKEAVAKVAEEKPKEVPVFCRFRSRTGFFRLQPRW
jgi:serine protease Do